MTAVIDLDSTATPGDALAHRVLSSPGGGSGTYFPTVPAGIGLQLSALGIVLGLLSAANANLFNTAATPVVIPGALSVGAVAIFVGGILNFRAGIMVAGMIGCLYGAFWLSVGLMLQFGAAQTISASDLGSFKDGFGTYLFLWGVLSLLLCAPVAFVSKVVLAQQALLALVFFVLAFGYWSGSHGTGLAKTGGWIGLVDAAICFYIATALVTNETAGKAIVPLP